MTRIAADWLQGPAVSAVFKMLAAGGQQGWCVGGCVRNALLGAPVADIDIATPARPDTVMALAADAGLKAVPTGIAHGTVTVVSAGQPLEVTTFRRDVETDGRRAVVAFADTLEEDAHRRDFTMNALYADAAGEVIDPLGGLADLNARRVRFIDRPEDRIGEDYLRILRFFRFHAWYGDAEAGLDPAGLSACAALARGMAALSRERIGAEMKKLLAAPDPAPTLATMVTSGVLAQALPEADAGGIHALVTLECRHDIAPRWQRRLAEIARRDPVDGLRLSRAEATDFKAISRAVTDARPLAETAYRQGPAAALDAALILAARNATDLAADIDTEIARGARARFPLSAKDIVQRVPPGPALGATLRRLEAAWVASDFTLDAPSLLALDGEDG